MTHPTGAVDELSGLTTPGPAGALPHGFMQHHREGMAGSPAAHPRFPEPEADPPQPQTRRPPPSKSGVNHETASTPFVLALRAAGAAC